MYYAFNTINGKNNYFPGTPRSLARRTSFCCSVVEEFVCRVFEPVSLHFDEMVAFVVVVCDDDARLVETSASHDHGDDDEEHDDENTSTQTHDDGESEGRSLRGFDLRFDGFDVAI